MQIALLGSDSHSYACFYCFDAQVWMEFGWNSTLQETIRIQYLR